MANLAPHETLELHELLSTDSAEIKKLSSTVNIIKDKDLKAYFQNYINFKKANIEALTKLVDTISTQT